MKLDIAEAAAGDLEEIARFGRTRWGDGQARRYQADLRQRMRALAAGHIPGAPAGEVAPGLRRQVAGSHVIWFRVEGDRLRVIRVLHASRDAARYLGDG